MQRYLMCKVYAGVLRVVVPSIAAVHGYALGGGLELALSCDLIVADESAILGLPEVSVGLVPGGGGTQLLTRRIGWGRAADLIFTARRIDAEEAYRLGIVDRLVMKPGEALTRRLADSIETSVKLAGGLAFFGWLFVRLAGMLLSPSYQIGLYFLVVSWIWIALVAGYLRFRVAATQPQPHGK
jgi:enoyl-CoA hydratase/carnithine racemase